MGLTRTNWGRTHFVELRTEGRCPHGGAFDQVLRVASQRGEAIRLFPDLDEGGRRAMTDPLIGGSEDEPL